MDAVRSALDAERRRVAEELHAGVAQQLTHLRLELDHLSKQGAGAAAMRRDLAGLARVANETLAGLRSTIYALNGLATPGHLYSRIADAIAEVAASTLDVRFVPTGVPYLRSTDEQQVLTFVGAKLRRAVADGATAVVVRIAGGLDEATVEVDTDGQHHVLTIAAQEGAA